VLDAGVRLSVPVHVLGANRKRASRVLAEWALGDTNMAWFNAFQIVVLFAGLPFLIHWLHTAEFWGASSAFWVTLVVYVIAFFMHILAMANFIEKT
jgi:hypothetical protein